MVEIEQSPGMTCINDSSEKRSDRKRVHKLLSKVLYVGCGFGKMVASAERVPKTPLTLSNRNVDWLLGS